tara:strand:+ start:2674 stop:2895 length:222 start_codon:yes stop_codon:yes gene_type:complete
MEEINKSFDSIVLGIKKNLKSEIIVKNKKTSTFIIIILLAILFDLILFGTWYVFIWLDIIFFHPLDLNDFTDG